MIETSEPPWAAVVLALVTACALAPAEEAARPVDVQMAGTPALPEPHDGSAAERVPATADAIRATAKVCIYCTGVAPADGHVYATVYLTIDAAIATDLRIASLELIDAHGAVVAHGAAPQYVGIVTAGHSDVGPFSGRLAAGAHIVLWTGSQLDVGALQPLPTRYRLHLVALGRDVVVGGAMEPQGSTA